MEYENQQMDYEDTDVRYERTVSSVPNVRIFCTLHLFAEICCHSRNKCIYLQLSQFD